MKKKLIILIVVVIAVVVLGFILYQNFWFKKIETKNDFLGHIDVEDLYVKGVLVVGFNKDVSQTLAEEILNNLGLEFFRTRDVNRGMVFFEKTGETFLVKVPGGQEEAWDEKIRKIPGVYDAGPYVDPSKALLD